MPNVESVNPQIETVSHLSSGCGELAQLEYKKITTEWD